jgi:hypothetical protein
MAEPAFRASDILDRMRLLKADATYTPTSLLLWLTDGVIELYTHCPRARQKVDAVGMRDFTILTDINGAVPCSIMFMPLLVDYVMARALMEDSDSQDHRSRAADHFKLFLERAQLIQYGMPNRQTPAPPAAPGGR